MHGTGISYSGKPGFSARGRASRLSFLISAVILALGAQTSVLLTRQPCSFFEFSPTAASFTAGGGTGSVACDQGVVTNGVYTGCGWTAVSNVPWLTVISGDTSDRTGFGTVQYTVQPNPSALGRIGTLTFSNGNYLSATYTITQAGGNPNPSNAPITTTPAALVFYYQRGQSLPSTQTLNVVTNPGNLQFTISTPTNKGGAWLVASAASNTSASNGAAAISVSVNPTGLTPGVYSGDVVVSQPASTQISSFSRDAAAAISTPVTLTVSDNPPHELVTPTVLQFVYNPAVPDALPPPQAVSITSSNGIPTPYTLTTCVLTPAIGANWLSVGARTTPELGFIGGRAVTLTNGSSGSTQSVSGVTPATINISVNPVSLSPGRYVALLRYNSTASCPTSPPPPAITPGDATKQLIREAVANSPNVATAIIVSVGNGALIPSQQDITFDDTTPPLQSATVVALGRAFAVSPSIISLNAPDGWLTMSPPGLSGTPAAFDVTAAATDITLQQYNGILVFSDTNGVTGTAITVEAVPGSSATAWRCQQQLPNGRISQVCAVNFLGPANAAVNSQSVNITNLSTGSAVVVPVSDVGWLGAPSTIAIPGPLTFTADTTSLMPGTYGGSVTISGDGVNAPPMVIPVSLTLQ